MKCNLLALLFATITVSLAVRTQHHAPQHHHYASDTAEADRDLSFAERDLSAGEPQAEQRPASDRDEWTDKEDEDGAFKDDDQTSGYDVTRPYPTLTPLRGNRQQLYDNELPDEVASSFADHLSPELRPLAHGVLSAGVGCSGGKCPRGPKTEVKRVLQRVYVHDHFHHVKVKGLHDMWRRGVAKVFGPEFARTLNRFPPKWLEKKFLSGEDEQGQRRQ